MEEKQEAIEFFKDMFADISDVASHAIKGSETEKEAAKLMRHLELAINALEKEVN